MIFNADEMTAIIEETAYDEKTNPNVADVLKYHYEAFLESRYENGEIDAAIKGNQLCADTEDVQERAKSFKKVPKERLYEIVSQMCFMYGLAYGEKVRRNERD